MQSSCIPIRKIFNELKLPELVKPERYPLGLIDIFHYYQHYRISQSNKEILAKYLLTSIYYILSDDLIPLLNQGIPKRLEDFVLPRNNALSCYCDSLFALLFACFPPLLEFLKPRSSNNPSAHFIPRTKYAKWNGITIEALEVKEETKTLTTLDDDSDTILLKDLMLYLYSSDDDTRSTNTSRQIREMVEIGMVSQQEGDDPLDFYVSLMSKLNLLLEVFPVVEYRSEHIVHDQVIENFKIDGSSIPPWVMRDYNNHIIKDRAGLQVDTGDLDGENITDHMKDLFNHVEEKRELYNHVDYLRHVNKYLHGFSLEVENDIKRATLDTTIKNVNTMIYAPPILLITRVIKDPWNRARVIVDRRFEVTDVFKTKYTYVLMGVSCYIASPKHFYTYVYQDDTGDSIIYQYDDIRDTSFRLIDKPTAEDDIGHYGYLFFFVLK